MKTVVKKINPENMSSEDFALAAQLLREGKLVAFPTETVYGLGGDAYDKTASARIYAAKGRPSDNPLIVHIAEIGELEKLAVNIPEEAYLLAEKFWPGPMTMILNRKDTVPKETTGGLDTVAIRMPSHPIARRLIIESGLPIAAPSANASGRPSTTKAEHVIEDLDGKIDMIIDGGSSDIGLESTIVDLTVKPALILRPGYITKEMLQEILPDIEYDKAVLKRVRDDTIVAKAPGMKYRHYAPKGQLTIFEGEREKVIARIVSEVREKMKKNLRVGILASTDYLKSYIGGIFDGEASPEVQNAIADALNSGAAESGQNTSEALNVGAAESVQNTLEALNAGAEVAGQNTSEALNSGAAEAGQNTSDVAGTADNVDVRECVSANGKQSENGDIFEIGNVVIGIVGSRNDEATIAARLFDILREYDTKKIDYIYAECFASDNLGQAIMNRLLKAAGYHIETL